MTNRETRGDAILNGEDRPVHLKLSFLLPLALVFFGLTATFAFLTHHTSQQQVADSTQQTTHAVQNMFRHGILENSSMLEAVSHTLLRNRDIEAALMAKDRSRLLGLSKPLFTKFSKDHRITHFYYHDSDRTNLLRVHKPERFGDKINRFTMIEAESIGAISSGIELRPLGTFTLRLVTPWHDSKQRLIGYIELGMEIDAIIESIEQLYNVDIYMFVNKKYLDKALWIEGMKMLNYHSDWGILNRYVILSYVSEQALPAELMARYDQHGTITQAGFGLMFHNHQHRAMPLPLEDKGKRNVGNMWVLIDIDREISDSRRITLIATGVAIALGAILFMIFFRLVSGIESELSKHQQALRLIASNDGLTGVFNRRSFDIIMASEFERARRYDRELSLLFIDIDHFKHINDSFGHAAGDQVLKELTSKLSGQLRTNDHLARYGGEEFAIILPETPQDMAHAFAERLRTSAGEQDYEVGNNLSSHITLSIGVSAFQTQTETYEELIAQADRALYEAKEAGRNRVCSYKQDAGANS